MSIIQTSGYTDFKTVASVKHYKDIFYYDSGAGLFVIYAVSDDGFTINSGNLTTQPGSFTTDFPTAIALTTTLSLA